MAEQGYGLTREHFRQLRQTVRRVRTDLAPGLGRRGKGEGPAYKEPIWAKITSTTQDTGRYPATLGVIDEPTKTVTDLSVDVWLRAVNGADLEEGTWYLAMPEGEAAGASETRPGYVTSDPIPATASTFSGARVALAGQSINDNTATVLSWTSETWDVGGYFDPGTPTRLTVPAAGYYLVGVSLTWPTGNNAGFRHVILTPSGAGGTFADTRGVSGTSVDVSICGLWNLASGDYLTATVHHTDGAALSVSQAKFWIHEVH